MASVAVVPHALRPEATALATRAVRWLVGHGHDVRVPEEDATVAELAEHAWPTEKLAAGLDLALSLGGDGTMLRTVDLVSPCGVPVLGVNAGRLGYLTEVEAAGLEVALERFFTGDYTIEERMTLQVDVEGEGAEGRSSWSVLNEAVLGKTVSGHMLHLFVSVNDAEFTTYAADAVIVCTPTGSTAYNLSARGPIVSPRHRALVVTPVSPHMLFDRSLVLSAEEWVHLRVLDGLAAELAVDGRSMGALQPGAAVACRAGPHDAHLVTFDGRDFQQILKAKFNLADR